MNRHAITTYKLEAQDVIAATMYSMLLVCLLFRLA